MKVVISSGHGKYIRGASGSPVPPQCDEVDEARKVVDRTAILMRDAGHNVIVFHDDQSDDQSENLNRIVNFHNAQGPHDWDVSVHFNAYDGTAHGCEVLYVSDTGETMAKKMVDAICDVSGLTNRGPKYRDGLAFLNGTNEPAVLVETCFCDNTPDCNIYRDHFEDICQAIAESFGADVAVPAPPPPISAQQKQAIMAVANASAIATYGWQDRGTAPQGYTQGFALAWSTVLLKYLNGDPVALEMAKPIGDPDLDALAWYQDEFDSFLPFNPDADPRLVTLRHLFVLLMGLGMRESSGEHCCGRDMSASNVSSDTAEAGLYQTSYNARASCDEFDLVMGEYEAGKWPGYLDEFAEDVTCSASEWACYGSGSGYAFQELCKNAPAFAAESCALVLRNLRQHYGPINRKEAELRPEADRMLFAIQEYIKHTGPIRPPVRPDLPLTALEALEARVTALEEGIWKWVPPS